MKNIETKTLIEVEGAILTSEALNKIRQFQNNNNDHLCAIREQLSDTVCWIAFNLSGMPEEQKDEANEQMCFLSLLRNDIDCLRKP